MARIRLTVFIALLTRFKTAPLIKGASPIMHTGCWDSRNKRILAAFASGCKISKT